MFRFPTLTTSQAALLISMMVVGLLAFAFGGPLSVMAVMTGFVVAVLLTAK